MINNSYDICVGCYGERYYKQVNQMISAFSGIPDQPPILIVPDNTDK